MRLFFTLLCFISALNLASAQKKRLSLKLNEGTTYKQSMTGNSVINQEFDGMEMEFKVTISGSMSYTVTKKNKGSYDMDVHYDRLSMHMSLPQGEMLFDSESTDENDIFSKIMASMIDKSFGVKMAANGKILEINRIEVLFESIFDGFPMLSETQLQPIKDQLMKAYGAEAFKGNIEMVSAVFPDKRVAPGESWLIDTKLQSGMEADIHSTYTYAETNKDHILITGEAKMETVNKEAYITVNGSPTKYDLDGTMTSTLKVDKKTGWIIHGQIEQKMSGDVSVKPGGTTEAMVIPMEMINIMSIANN